jgi:hypothetical protein
MFGPDWLSDLSHQTGALGLPNSTRMFEMGVRDRSSPHDFWVA